MTNLCFKKKVIIKEKNILIIISNIIDIIYLF